MSTISDDRLRVVLRSAEKGGALDMVREEVVVLLQELQDWRSTGQKCGLCGGSLGPYGGEYCNACVRRIDAIEAGLDDDDKYR